MVSGALLAILKHAPYDWLANFFSNVIWTLVLTICRIINYMPLFGFSFSSSGAAAAVVPSSEMPRRQSHGERSRSKSRSKRSSRSSSRSSSKSRRRRLQRAAAERPESDGSVAEAHHWQTTAAMQRTRSTAAAANSQQQQAKPCNSDNKGKQ